MTSHRDFAPVPDLTAAQGLVEQAGERAKRQLDHDIFQANEAMDGLLDDIVRAARNDDPNVLQRWKEHRMKEFNGSSRTLWAYELFKTKGGLSAMLDKLHASSKPAVSQCANLLMSTRN